MPTTIRIRAPVRDLNSMHPSLQCLATKTFGEEPKRQNQLTHTQRREHEEHNTMPEEWHRDRRQLKHVSHQAKSGKCARNQCE